MDPSQMLKLLDPNNWRAWVQKCSLARILGERELELAECVIVPP